MKKEKGIVLILAVALTALFLSVSAYLVRLAFLDNKMVYSQTERTAAFYAAEGGIEWAKAKLAASPDWFTDLPFSSQNDSAWLIKDASGFSLSVGDNYCKIVREKNRGYLYSIGYSGASLDAARSISILKIKFSSPPFEQASWEEI